MSAVPSAYEDTVGRLVVPKLRALGFTEVRLKDCISYEILFRSGDLWFGTSWDRRDRYLDLDMGHLYWFRDVMPRVVIAGAFSSFSSHVELADANAGDYLEQVSQAVAESLDEAVSRYQGSPDLGDSKISRLRPHIIGRADDASLRSHEA